MVIPFQCLFYAYLRWVLSTGDLPEWNEQTEQICSQSCSHPLGACGLIPFWSSLLSCVGLVIVTMGPLHLRPLILLDQQLIIVARLQPFPHQDCGRAAFFPASRSDDQSLPWGKCCLPPSGRVRISLTIRTSVVKLLCHASPVLPRFRVNGSRCSPYGIALLSTLSRSVGRKTSLFGMKKL